MKNDTLSSSLRTVISKLHKRLSRQMRTVDGLSMTEVTTLSNLFHHSSLFPSEMAEMVKVKAQSMSQVLNHLEELKLISKTPSSTDKRKVSISLTSYGREMVEHTREERDEWLSNAIAQHLSADEQELLQKAVTLIDRLTE
ncbi:MarR family winged helix-turn-helix transcriptional regulator [Pedobacter sp. L105]|uniref:MarR family winged helix-turn-helix transcriptional regulator n=1 Tax=Pedobacter sp. L105 TaxID=1641871 RepID=UPI00131DDD1F|nr:MarR family transcriptional regulator [Pedobacter sp. L105]